MIDVVVFGIIIASFITIGLLRKVSSQSTYLFADRKAGFISLTATLVMTELNPATLIAFTGLGYLAGPRALFLPLVFLIGIAFYSVSVAKKYSELGASSVTDIFRIRYTPRLATLASSALIIAMLGFTATYVKSLTLIFAPLTSLSPLLLSAILVLLTLAMTMRGGLIAIIRTDIVSLLLMLIFLPLLFYFSPGPLKTVPHAATLIPSRFIISLIVLTMFTYILAPWYGQKIFSARTPKIAVSATLTASLLVFALYGLAIVSAASLHADVSPETSLPYLIHHLPNGLRGTAYALLFLAGSTTLAGVWSAIASMVPLQPIKTTLLTAVLSFLLGNVLVDRVLDKLILANIPVAALSFALLAGLYWKRATTLGAYGSIITGLLWGIGCYLFCGEGYTWYWAMYGIPLIFVVGIGGSLREYLKI